MLTNRSMPREAVIPVLACADVRAAASWLCDAFGFTVRLRIGDHRIQLNVEGGAVVLSQGEGEGSARVLVRVEDVDAHHARAVARGARAQGAPQSHAYGERQYSVEDPQGNQWTFSQSIADVDPASWGGAVG